MKREKTPAFDLNPLTSLITLLYLILMANLSKRRCRFNFLSILAILLLLSGTLLFDPLITNLSWLRYQKIRLQRNIHRKIEAGKLLEHLILLEFKVHQARSQIKWLSSKEFEYNHRLYDVVESIQVGGSVFYWCWPDDQETQLQAKIKNIIKQAFSQLDDQKLKSLTEVPPQIIPLVKTLWATLTVSKDFPLPSWANELAYVSDDFYLFITFPPLTPPPQLLG